jgi:hypothetical protein
LGCYFLLLCRASLNEAKPRSRRTE